MKAIVLLLFANAMVFTAQAQEFYRTLSTTDLVRTEDPSGTEYLYVSELNAIETNTETLVNTLESPSTTLDLHALVEEVESQQDALNETSAQLQNITDEYDATLQYMSNVLKTLHDTTTSMLHQM